MARKFLVSIDLNKNELQNAVVQNLGTAPGTPIPGQIYYNTSENSLYFYDNNSWVNVLNESEVIYGSYAAIPTAGVEGRLFFATDQNILYFDNGSAWVQVSAFGNVSAQTSYGASSGNGTANTYSRSDHTHGTPSLSNTTPSSLSVGGSGSAGSGSAPSRDDHAHAMPSFGNVTAQTSFGGSSDNGSSTSIARADHQHGTPVHDNAAHALINLSALAAPTGDVSFGGYKITSLADPVSNTDAANKQYVDSVAQGLNIHDPVQAGTTASLASLTGGTVTYNNGTAGVGATLTLSVALTTLDGYTLVTGDRIIVKNEATQANNGVYTINSAKTVLTRATDADTTTELNGGDFFFIQNGTTLDNTGWVIVDKVTTVGTTPVIFYQFSGAGTYTEGDGIDITGTVISAVVAPGGGLYLNGAGLSIDVYTVVRKYGADVGDGTATSYTITHNLGTKDVQVTVYDNTAPYAEVICDVQHTSTSAVTLLFSVAPTSNQYRVVVQG